MPNVNFWQKRFQQLGSHSVGPGDTQNDQALEYHRLLFYREISPYLLQMKGPVLDFGCGVGRWVKDLPRPYLGLDLTPEHIEECKRIFGQTPDVEFGISDAISDLPDKTYNSILTITVLQHIVEADIRAEVLQQFKRLLSPDGVFLSVEWSQNQKQYDWCNAVSERELKKYFKVEKKGLVVEQGRQHTIWLCKQKKAFLWFM